MNILFVARSYLMLLNVINLRLNVYQKENADLIFTNDSNNSEAIYEKLKQLNIFDNVYYVKHEEFAPEKTPMDKIKTTFTMYIRPEKYLVFMDINKKYDKLIMYTVYRKLEDSIYCLLKKKNSNIEIYLYEEGYINYIYENGYHEIIKGNLKKISNIHKFMCTIFAKKLLINNISGFYYYNPELIIFNPPYPVYTMPKLNREDKKFGVILDQLFELSKIDIDSEFDSDIVYFEQSLFGEDENILEKEIIHILNKATLDVVVKRHPRIKTNKYKNDNIKICSSNSIPWEALQYKKDFDGKIMMSICSSSVFSSYLYYGDCTKIILLYKMYKNNELGINNEKFERFTNQFKKMNLAEIYEPLNSRELENVLRSIDEHKDSKNCK